VILPQFWTAHGSVIMRVACLVPALSSALIVTTLACSSTETSTLS
jgi:hypothetical protein